MPTKTLKRKLPYYPEKLLAEQKSHGGKSYLARTIFEHAPRHYTKFADLFLGGGSMTYNAPAGLSQQIAVEKNHLRWLSKYVVKNHVTELLAILKDIEYNEATFEIAKTHVELFEQTVRQKVQTTNSVEHQVFHAAQWIIRSKFSRGGLGEAYSWSERTRGKRSVGGPKPEQMNNWLSMLERLPLLSTRLQPVHLFCGLAQDWIVRIGKESVDQTQWFCYLDPPYWPATRSTKATEYGDEEMTTTQHVDLLRLLLNYPKINFAVSSYRNDTYDEILSEWKRTDFEIANHSGQGKVKQRRTESLYVNYSQ